MSTALVEWTWYLIAENQRKLEWTGVHMVAGYAEIRYRGIYKSEKEWLLGIECSKGNADMVQRRSEEEDA